MQSATAAGVGRIAAALVGSVPLKGSLKGYYKGLGFRGRNKQNRGFGAYSILL